MKAVFQSRLFVLGLLCRLAALPFFGSSITHGLFLPFLDEGITHLGGNPWAAMSPEHFPYGVALYAVMVLPKLLAYQLVGDVALGSTYLSMALFSVPLLCFDFLTLRQLLALAPRRHRQIYWYYWLNPIVFYVCYVHGQLDIVATALSLVALRMLAADRVTGSATVMALATLCKAHVAVVVPLALAYLWNRHYIRRACEEIAKWLGLWAAVTALGFAPHMAAHALGYVTTASPQAGQVFAAQVPLGHEQLLYVGVAAVVGLLARLCSATRMTPMGLLLGAGILFGALVVVTGASPGWYIWCMPYVALFYATYVVAPQALLWAVYGLYAAHFGADLFWGSGVPLFWQSATFTLLQTSLAGLLTVLWVVGVRAEAPLQGRVRPLLIGIAGDSGAGKNLLSNVMADLFESDATAILEGDDYHKWERGHARWGDYTHLHPRANHLEEMAAHTQDLLHGRLIFAPQYDHGTGTFTAPREVYGRKLVIVQGLHTLYLRQMRQKLDLKIFLAPHPLVRLAWKVKRDVAERGYPLQKVLATMRSRADDSEEHINPQKFLADWVIEVLPTTPLTEESVIGGESFGIKTQHILWNDAPVTSLLAAFAAQSDCRVDLDTVAGDINRMRLCIDGNPTTQQVEAIACDVFPDLPALTRGYSPPAWHDGQQGINQLLGLALLQGNA